MIVMIDCSGGGRDGEAVIASVSAKTKTGRTNNRPSQSWRKSIQLNNGDDYGSSRNRRTVVTATMAWSWTLRVWMSQSSDGTDWNSAHAQSVGDRWTTNERPSHRPKVTESVLRMGTVARPSVSHSQFSLATDPYSVGIMTIDVTMNGGRRTAGWLTAQLLAGRGWPTVRVGERVVTDGQLRYFYENSCSPRRRDVETR